jgi:hypothetical protein
LGPQTLAGPPHSISAVRLVEYLSSSSFIDLTPAIGRNFQTETILAQLRTGSNGALFRILGTWAWFICIAIAGIECKRGL